MCKRMSLLVHLDLVNQTINRMIECLEYGPEMCSEFAPKRWMIACSSLFFGSDGGFRESTGVNRTPSNGNNGARYSSNNIRLVDSTVATDHAGHNGLANGGVNGLSYRAMPTGGAEVASVVVVPGSNHSSPLHLVPTLVSKAIHQPRRDLHIPGAVGGAGAGGESNCGGFSGLVCIRIRPDADGKFGFHVRVSRSDLMEFFFFPPPPFKKLLISTTSAYVEVHAVHGVEVGRSESVLIFLTQRLDSDFFPDPSSPPPSERNVLISSLWYGREVFLLGKKGKTWSFEKFPLLIWFHLVWGDFFGGMRLIFLLLCFFLRFRAVWIWTCRWLSRESR